MFKYLVVFATVLLLFTGTVYAQEAVIIDINYTAGASFSIADDENGNKAVDFSAVTGLFHVDILEFNFMDATSGVSLEAMYANKDFNYAVWSLNRVSVPGSKDRVYAGTDLKLLQSDENNGPTADFDVRIIAGTRIGKIGPGALKFESYFIEENIPISFAVLYDW